MDGGQVSSGIRLERLGGKERFCKSRAQIGPFSEMLVRIASRFGGAPDENCGSGLLSFAELCPFTYHVNFRVS